MLNKLIQLFVVNFFILLIGLTVSYGQLNYQHNQHYQPKNPEVPRITAFEAMELYKQGKLILANAQERGRFSAGHIIGSINLPNDEVQSMNINLPKNLIIAFY